MTVDDIEKGGVDERYSGMVMCPAIRLGNALVFGSLSASDTIFYPRIQGHATTIRIVRKKEDSQATTRAKSNEKFLENAVTSKGGEVEEQKGREMFENFLFPRSREWEAINKNGVCYAVRRMGLDFFCLAFSHFVISDSSPPCIVRPTLMNKNAVQAQKPYFSTDENS